MFKQNAYTNQRNTATPHTHCHSCAAKRAKCLLLSLSFTLPLFLLFIGSFCPLCPVHSSTLQNIYRRVQCCMCKQTNRSMHLIWKGYLSCTGPAMFKGHVFCNTFHTLRSLQGPYIDFILWFNAMIKEVRKKGEKERNFMWNLNYLN